MCLFPRQCQILGICSVSRRYIDRSGENKCHRQMAATEQYQRTSILPRIMQLLLTIRAGLFKNRITTYQPDEEGEQLCLDRRSGISISKLEARIDPFASSETSRPERGIYRHYRRIGLCSWSHNQSK